MQKQLEELIEIQECIKLLAHILEILPKARDKYIEICNKIVRDCDQAMLDLMHYIELNDFTDEEGLIYVKQQKKVRRVRRIAKDTLLLLNALPEDLQLQSLKGVNIIQGN